MKNGNNLFLFMIVLNIDLKSTNSAVFYGQSRLLGSGETTVRSSGVSEKLMNIRSANLKTTLLCK